MVGIGSTVGNYRVIKKLGSGAMGAVYLAEHPQIGKRVALKVIHPDLADNAEMVSRFFNEARAVNQIGHEHIVTVLDFGQTPDGDNFIVMELLEGEGLGDRLKREPTLPVATMIRISIQIAEGLAASHTHGIIHRDLKPDNIFLIERLGQPDYVKILDFGLAKLSQGGGAMSHKTRAGAVLGTPHYMAPEQAEGKPDIDARADVYALGCLMYHMLCGRVPFPGEGFGEVLIKHLREPPLAPSKLNPSVPPEIEKIVLQTLAKGKEFRFQSMGELIKALRDPDKYARALEGSVPLHLITGELPAPRATMPHAAVAPPAQVIPQNVPSIAPSAPTMEFDTLAEGSRAPAELAAMVAELTGAPSSRAPAAVADDSARTVAEEMPPALREMLRQASLNVVSTGGTASAFGAGPASTNVGLPAPPAASKGAAPVAAAGAPAKRPNVAETARVAVVPRRADRSSDTPAAPPRSAASRTTRVYAAAGGGLVLLGAIAAVAIVARRPAPVAAPAVVETVAVTIDTDPPEAEVWKDERPLGNAPVIMRLRPGAGAVTVTARKEGYIDVERGVDASLAPRVVITLVPAPDSVDAGSAPAPAEKGPAPAKASPQKAAQPARVAPASAKEPAPAKVAPAPATAPAPAKVAPAPANEPAPAKVAPAPAKEPAPTKAAAPKKLKAAPKSDAVMEPAF